MAFAFRGRGSCADAGCDCNVESVAACARLRFGTIVGHDDIQVNVARGVWIQTDRYPHTHSAFFRKFCTSFEAAAAGGSPRPPPRPPAGTPPREREVGARRRLFCRAASGCPRPP